MNLESGLPVKFDVSNPYGFTREMKRIEQRILVILFPSIIDTLMEMPEKEFVRKNFRDDYVNFSADSGYMPNGAGEFRRVYANIPTTGALILRYNEEPMVTIVKTENEKGIVYIPQISLGFLELFRNRRTTLERLFECLA
jgi:hypothetical protein